MAHNEQHQTVAHLFRNEYGKVTALLTRKFGPTHLEAIEDAVQDTFLKAMQVWGYKEVPENPTAWLFRVAHNAMIDHFRRSKKIQYGDVPGTDQPSETNEVFTSENELTDSQLKLVFACCDPLLSAEHQLILSLKLMGGFSNKELAEALLKKEETVAKSYTRAKKKFREEVTLVRFPVEMGLQSRLFIVLRVIYLLFTEGYAATTGALVLKKDICYEALRLALLLRENKYCQHPKLEALIALMCFHVARFDARIDTQGNFVSLDKHDRSLYDQELIQIGLQHLQQARTEKPQQNNYLLEAAVSYEHCAAPAFETTNWEAILRLYDFQIANQPSPMRHLNRIVALEKVQGAKKALLALEQLASEHNFEAVGLFYAIKAELLQALNDEHYQETLDTAIALTANELLKKHLMSKRSSQH